MIKKIETKKEGGRTVNFKTKLAMGLMVATAFSACKTRSAFQTAGSNGLTAPPGMVYIPSGTITYNNPADSAGKGKMYSVSAFYIDKTEVTNEEYSKFINWVADSVAITDYLKDEKFFIKEKGAPKISAKTNTTPTVTTVSTITPAKRIDWSKVDSNSPLWKSNKNGIQGKIAAMFIDRNGAKILNPDKVKYRFSYMRKGGAKDGQYVTDTVSVMPETDIWSKDFPNAQMSLYDRNYLTHKAFKTNPVVGVNWKQARAYTDWKGKEMTAMANKNPYLRGFNLAYSLPSEAQWQRAAVGSDNSLDTSAMNLTKTDKKTKKQLLAINFKQGEGSYSKDGSTFTVPVTSYSPNGFGLYNMFGNVSEWTLDAYSPSSSFFINDLNPVLLLDADNNDAEALTRKVIRGGSWKDPGSLLNADARNYESQFNGHSYIGFRCAMAAIEMNSPQLKAK
ncbi:SUMF1/EgtB/PvdO family nonheme iron enzyme [Pedobacter sp. MC2016-14]|uniref:SUMF1/EgtB/PvdO family nonheme iron enzyme n=1 Tax=Pedobacter sp. MC2016-14 TaxID=2897327 RepID=UPI001E43A439|nr:SUMF1/EgtB/PvdO family nonheme iron enzyme [Pedobacter sp. MC2016-14]MCD0486876.1 SUMF1/EgtB/PvdO family nonheme iron enzyme [Pedobacter sp. MC2016-14]